MTACKRPAAKQAPHTCNEEGTGDVCLGCAAIDERVDELHPIINPLDGTRWKIAPGDKP